MLLPMLLLLLLLLLCACGGVCQRSQQKGASRSCRVTRM
jgi:hypothetical protein